MKHNYTIKNTFCKKCGLYKKATHPCIVGRGDPASGVLVVGEYPNTAEDAANQIFMGQVGTFLQHHLHQADLSCFITNAVLCKSADAQGNNKPPLPTTVSCCKAFTIDLIRTLKPKVIITLGSVPLRQLLAINANIAVIHGRKFYHPELETTIIPTYHPSFLLKNNDRRYVDEFISDLRLAKEALKAPASRRIRSAPKTIKDPIELSQYLTSLLTVKALAIDIETTGLDPKKDKITDISLCSEIGKGVHIAWELISDDGINQKLFKEVLLTDSEKIFHNAVFDMQFLRALSFKILGKIFDTMLGYHTLTMSHEGGKAASLYKLKTMAWFLTQEGGYESVLAAFGGIVGVQKYDSDEDIIEDLGEDAVATVKDVKYEQVPLFDEDELARVAGFDVAMNNRLVDNYSFIDRVKSERMTALKLSPKEFYAAMDADVTYRIYKYLKYVIDEQYAYSFYNIIMPMCLIVMRMHENGIQIDSPYIDKLIEENNINSEEVKKQFFKEAGYEFNINSTPQLTNFMYVHLKLPVNEKFLTKKGRKPSTDEPAIEFFSKRKPILTKILDYRGIQKQTSTYLEGFKKLADSNHRVYPSYHQAGTATGRLSAKNPNIHNIPGDNRIRNMIVPAPGHKLIVADMSQVELRILAMISGDTNMIQAFKSGHDFHTYTACVMFGIPIASFDKKNPDHATKRTSAKKINFGIVYQMRAESLAADLGIPLVRAQEFMHLFFSTYPKVQQWIDYIKSFARQNGYVETLYGRRRYLPDIKSSDMFVREGAERKSVNTPIQSSAGDIAFIGITRMQDWLDERALTAKIVGTVHDSVLIETPFSEVDTVAEVLPIKLATDIPRVTIDLKADLDILDKWKK